MTLAIERWTAREAPSFAQIYISPIGSMPFACVFNPDQGPPAAPLDADDRARARLIAAAPQLARALRAMVDACNDKPPGWLVNAYADGLATLVALGPPFEPHGWSTEELS